MKKSTRNIVILLLAIGAGTLIVVFDNVLLGAMVASWTMLYWGWSGHEHQEVTADARGLNPKTSKNTVGSILARRSLIRSMLWAGPSHRQTQNNPVIIGITGCVRLRRGVARRALCW